VLIETSIRSERLLKDIQIKKKETKDGESIDINDWNSLLSCAQHLLESTAIAVDV